ncbi:MAG: hypothetical protein MHMPM18_002252 [Marteilia pararefringens]
MMMMMMMMHRSNQKKSFIKKRVAERCVALTFGHGIGIKLGVEAARELRCDSLEFLHERSRLVLPGPVGLSDQQIVERVVEMEPQIGLHKNQIDEASRDQADFVQIYRSSSIQ